MDVRTKKLKILLTQPLFGKRQLFGDFNPGRNANTFVFGQAFLGAVAREAGHEVTILDPFHEETTPEQYISFLKEHQFDVIGCTIYTLTFNSAKKLFEYSRAALPNACLIAGGTHPTSLPEDTLKKIPALDIVVYGEGEITFKELLERLQDNKELGSVEGIAYRNKDGQIIKNPPRRFIEDLDILPMPAYDLFPIEEYVPPPNLVRRFPTIALQVSRGCPFRCAFCQYDIALGKKFRHRSVGKIIEELFYLKQRYKIRGIVFRDSTLTVDPKFTQDLCKAMIDNHLRLAWMCYSRTDVMAKYHKDLLPLMKKSGCWQIGYGCESANQKSLDMLQKKTTVEQNIKAVTETLRAGIMCSTTWIICLPGETADDAWRTVLLANKLATHIGKFFLPVPFPNTELEKICREDGGLREDASYDEYSMITPEYLVYINPLVGEAVMKKMLKDAYLKYYTNPKVLYRNLIKVTDWDMIRKCWHIFRFVT